MSVLSELIERYSPDGVEYRALNEIATFGGGHTPSKANASNYEEGGVWWVTSKDVKSDTLTSTGITLSETGAESLTLYPAGTLVMVARSGILRRLLPVAFLGEPMTINQDIKAIIPDSDTILPRYLFHVLKASDSEIRERYGKVGGTVDSVNFNMVKRHRIPVPPIEVQHEVVRILDEYAAAHDELVGQLKQEMKLRELQQSVARSDLMSKSGEVEWIPLNELCTNLDSKRRPVTKSSRTPGPYPYYGASGIVDYVSDYLFDGEYLLVAEDGANLVARSTPIAFTASGKTWVNNHAHILDFSDKTLQTYVEMYLNSIDLTEYITGAAQPKLSQKNLNRILVPIPIGNNLSAIVEQLISIRETSSQLLQVIEDERRQLVTQLALLRNQLLSFPEKVA